MKKINLISIQQLALVLVLFSTVLFSCRKENDEYLKPEQTAISKDQLLLASGSISDEGYNVENSLPKGYVKDGSKDYTTYIQSAISKYNKLVFPGFPILINDKGLVIGSNRTLNFLPGSELRLIPTSKGSYDILKVYNVSNVAINNVVIKGDGNKHKGTSGEGGKGIGIYSSSNVTIYNAKISDCWGDGIYIAMSSSNIIGKNIKIRKAYCNNNRRMGIAVIAVDGLKIESSYLGNTRGFSYSCGIDIEPNNVDDVIDNVLITDLTTENNTFCGVQVGLSKLYGKGNKSVNIEFINHKDNGSDLPFKASCYVTRRTGSEKVIGTLKLTNSIWNARSDNKYILQTALGDPSFNLVVSKPTISIGGKLLSSKSANDLLLSKPNINRTAVFSLMF